MCVCVQAGRREKKENKIEKKRKKRREKIRPSAANANVKFSRGFLIVRAPVHLRHRFPCALLARLACDRATFSRPLPARASSPSFLSLSYARHRYTRMPSYRAYSCHGIFMDSEHVATNTRFCRKGKSPVNVEK